MSSLPSWDYPRGAAGVGVLVDLGGERGIDAVALLAGSTLTAADLRDPDLEVTGGQELAVVRNLTGALGDEPGLGVAAGKRITLGMFGILGFAMVTSRTARDAIAISDRLGYGKHSLLFLRPSVEEHPDTVDVVYDDRELPADLRGFLVERDLAFCVSLLPSMFGDAPPVELDTVLEGPRAEALRAALPGARVKAGRARNAVVFDAAVVDQPLPNADEHTVAECERSIRELVSRRSRRTGVAARVRAAMLRDTAIPSLAAIAAERHVDPRTLRRQLSAEGTSYRALADEVRETLAVELLTNAGLTVEQVSERLGYTDAASFTRAFRRWTGTTPGHYVVRSRNPVAEY